MTRVMLDAATPANIPRAIKSQLVAGYKTGTPGQWWDGHWNDFPGMTMVAIDQAGSGAPVLSCNVIDVEPGCYPAQDVNQWRAWLDACTASRPTVYCDRSDFAQYVSPNWHGDVWLAAPGLTVPPDPRVIAVQTDFQASYDLSLVFDDRWPGTAIAPPPVKEREMLNGGIAPSGQADVPFPPGAFTEVHLFHDFNRAPLPVRIAVCSGSKGFTQITEAMVTSNHPVVVKFTEPDAVAVSLENRSGAPIGWTIA